MNRWTSSAGGDFGTRRHHDPVLPYPALPCHAAPCHPAPNPAAAFRSLRRQAGAVKRRKPTVDHIERVGKQAVELVMAIRVGRPDIAASVVSEVDDPMNVMVALSCMVNLLATDEQMADFGSAKFRVIPD